MALPVVRVRAERNGALHTAGTETLSWPAFQPAHSGEWAYPPEAPRLSRGALHLLPVIAGRLLPEGR